MKTPTYLVTVSITVICGISCSIANADSTLLYQQASDLEKKSEFAQALTLYEQVLALYTHDALAGPNNEGFRTKYIRCRQDALTGDIATAKKLADASVYQQGFIATIHKPAAIAILSLGRLILRKRKCKWLMFDYESSIIVTYDCYHAILNEYSCRGKGVNYLVRR